ncbi:MAG: cupin domain-containing protein [Desulfovibrio sp.]|jgi:quercetin dioxygenase-like cupin family protein|nr:cupin domain-containing protein [Desulfovibrio sp.]
MLVVNWKTCAENRVESYPYRGERLPVTGVTIRWLSDAGLDDTGSSTYGLRYFVVEKGGDIPIHKHFYVQTMYFLEGEFEVSSFREEDDIPVETRKVEAGDSAFIPSMEPHAIKNVGSGGGVFLCCICNVYGEEGAL